MSQEIFGQRRGMQLRPSFRHRSAHSASEAETRLADALTSQATCRGRMRDGRLEVSVVSDEPAFWAPELRARVTEEDGSAIVKGYYSPKTETWTLFLAIYALTVFSTGVGTVFGLAQWQLGSHAWALWSLPIGVFAVACVWLGARIGQRLGSDDMRTIEAFIRTTLPSKDD